MRFNVGTIAYPPYVRSSDGASTFALSGALSGGYSATWLAYGIIPLFGGTLSKIRVYVSAVTGTLGASDLVCDVYSTTNGIPGTSLESRATVTTTPTGAAWVEFTGFTISLTSGTKYWVVLRNADATPTTIFPTYQYSTWFNSMTQFGQPNATAYTVLTSTNSGGSWSSTSNLPSMVLEYSGGDKEGHNAQGFNDSSTNVVQIYSSREGGMMFTVPFEVNAIGAVAVVNYTGTPTGELRYRVYTGSGSSPTLLTTTATIARTNVSASNAFVPLYFSSVQTISAGTVVRVVLSETTQSDAVGNRYACNANALSSSDTNVLLPFASNPKRTYSTDGGATFSETDNVYLPIALLLDGDDISSPSASGGASSYTFIG